MKQVVNFRLSPHALSALTMLEHKLHLSKTAIVEKALSLYAKRELADQESILEFAGILSEKEANVMLEAIKTNKMNKEIKTKL